MSIPASQNLSERRLFVIRDADALGIVLEESNGALRVRSMSLPGLGGLHERDPIYAQGLERTLTAMLNSKDQSFSVKFGSSYPYNRSRYAKKGDALARKGKFFEAAATYALMEEDDPLIMANRCIALQLCGRKDEAFVESNKLIQLWPKWEMGYVRRAACQVVLQDIHGAIRTLAQGLAHIPENPALIRRLRAIIPTKEQEITCLGEDSDVMLTLFHPDFFVSNRFADIFSPNMPSNDYGMVVSKSFNPLIPKGSRAEQVNGLSADSCLYTELRTRITSGYNPAVLIVFDLSDINNGTSQARRRNSMDNLSSNNWDQEEKQLALRLAAVPQSFDQVIVFGAGYEPCNGDFYPQGTRNERPWFENENGICLSYEQCESGLCGWVIGDPNTGQVFYVLRPGHEPRGEDFGQWLAVANTLNPAPSFVGVGERVPSLQKLTTWIKDPRIRGTPQSVDTTLVPCLLGLKGHGIRLLEGGWANEAIEVFDLVIDQALAVAFGDERCSPATLSRIVDAARQYRSIAISEIDAHDSQDARGSFDILYEGFAVKVFEDQSRTILIRVLRDKDAIEISEKTPVVQQTRNRRRRSAWSMLGCVRVPMPTVSSDSSPKVMDSWQRTDLNMEVLPVGARKMLRLSNGNKVWETTLPDEQILDALKAWVARGDKMADRKSHLSSYSFTTVSQLY